MSDTDHPAQGEGLPGDLVQDVAERLRKENSSLREYGYQLALVPEDETDDAVPLPDDATQEDPPANGDGHWSEVEVQKLPNNDLRIHLRGYTARDGTRQEERTADLVRELLRETLL